LLGLFTVGRHLVAQPSARFVRIEGTIQRSDSTPFGGVRVVLPDGSAYLTDSNGYYFVIVPAGFSGAITPQGFTFAPPSYTYSNISSDQNNQNFTGGSYTMTGTIMQGPPNILPGANIALFIDSLAKGTVSDSAGHYTITIPQGYSGSIMPLSPLFSFSPSSRKFSPTATTGAGSVERGARSKAPAACLDKRAAP